MKFGIYLDQSQRDQLEFEVLSTEFKVYLVRLIERDDRFKRHSLIQMNRLINRSRTFLGLPIYVLEGDDWGAYEDAEYAWHNGEFELIFRRLGTVQLVEFVAELIEQEWFDSDEVNKALDIENASFSFAWQGESVVVDVQSIEDLEDEPLDEEHPNIRVLVRRMESSLDNKDYAGVLHASASIFETLAKDVVGIPTIQNQTLKSFFSRYEKDSKLPKKLRKKVLSVYEARNTTPLAGHGSLSTPSISKKEAITLSELTKAIVRIEYLLGQQVAANDS